MIGGGRIRAAAGNGVPSTEGRSAPLCGLQCPAVKTRNIPGSAVTAVILASGGQVRHSGCRSLDAVCVGAGP